MWFWKKKPKDKDDKRQSLIDAIEMRGKAADDLSNLLDRLMERRAPTLDAHEGQERRRG